MEIPDTSAYPTAETHTHSSAYQPIDVSFCRPKTRASHPANNASLIAHRPHVRIWLHA
jgi:hypothetical protein